MWFNRVLIMLIASSFSVILPAQMGYLYSHGILATQKQALKYIPFSSPEIRTFDYPDACESVRDLDRSKVTFGQRADILALQTACKAQKDDSQIIIGMSRGASAALNLMAICDQPQVQAMVLESPFDTVQAIVESLLKRRFYIGHIPGLTALAKKLLTTAFPCYDAQGLQTIDTVHLIRKDLPILIICSNEDTTVPASSSMRLYTKLRATGHNHVYLLALNSGQHSKLLQENDRHTYLCVVHAFYKKYNLPHDASLATQGKKRLQKCQPTVYEIEKLLSH